MPKKLKLALISLISLVSLIGLISFVSAQWEEPSEPPPGGQVAAPLNVGSDPQTKIGSLKVSEGLKTDFVETDWQCGCALDNCSGKCLAGQKALRCEKGTVPPCGPAPPICTGKEVFRKWKCGYEEQVKIGLPNSNYGIEIIGTGRAYGLSGQGTIYGIYGEGTDFDASGVYGVGNGIGYAGVSGTGLNGAYGVYGKGSPWAGYFAGDVNVTGDLCFDNTKCIDDWDDIGLWEELDNKLYPKNIDQNVGIGTTDPGDARLAVGGKSPFPSGWFPAQIYAHSGKVIGLYTQGNPIGVLSKGSIFGVYGQGSETGVYGQGSAAGVYGFGNGNATGGYFTKQTSGGDNHAVVIAKLPPENPGPKSAEGRLAYKRGWNDWYGVYGRGSDYGGWFKGGTEAGCDPNTTEKCEISHLGGITSPEEHAIHIIDYGSPGVCSDNCNTANLNSLCQVECPGDISKCEGGKKCELKGFGSDPDQCSVESSYPKCDGSECEIRYYVNETGKYYGNYILEHPTGTSASGYGVHASGGKYGIYAMPGGAGGASPTDWDSYAGYFKAGRGTGVYAKGATGVISQGIVDYYNYGQGGEGIRASGQRGIIGFSTSQPFAPGAGIIGVATKGKPNAESGDWWKNQAGDDVEAWGALGKTCSNMGDRKYAGVFGEAKKDSDEGWAGYFTGDIGVEGVAYINYTTANVSKGETTSSYQSCSSGQRVLGGGCQCQGNIKASHACYDGTAWCCTCSNNDGLYISIVCANVGHHYGEAMDTCPK